MTKTLTIRQFATIKRVAQNVNPLVVKKNKILSKLRELNDEYEALTEEIEGHEMGIKTLTGGYTSEDLICKSIEDTGKVDKNNKPIKVTKYEPNNRVIFNTDTNMYEIIDVPQTSDEELQSADEECVSYDENTIGSEN